MADDRRPMVSSDSTPVIGIVSLFFREAGAFWAQAYERAEVALRDVSRDLANDARSREERRRMEAQARLLEEMRRAKEAGLDPEAVLRNYQALPERR